MGLNKAFWSRFGQSWLYPEHLERHLILGAVREAATLRLPSFREGPEGRARCDTLVDVGCGDKPYQALFAGRVGRYVGLDYPTTFSRHMAGYGARVEVFAGAQDLPFQDGAADVVLCTQVLEHTTEPWTAFTEMARILRPGGRLIVTVPQEWGLHQEPHDYYRFTKYGLEHLAKRSGLTVEYLANRGGFWAMMGQRLSAFLYDAVCRRLLKRSKLAFRLSAAVVLPACAAVQLLALGADRLQPSPANTLGYVMVARKP